jgi:hypothetical protein
VALVGLLLACATAPAPREEETYDSFSTEVMESLTAAAIDCPRSQVRVDLVNVSEAGDPAPEAATTWSAACGDTWYRCVLRDSRPHGSIVPPLCGIGRPSPKPDPIMCRKSNDARTLAGLR